MRQIYILWALLVGISFKSTAQTLDPTFGDQGKVITSVGPNSTLMRTVIQQDGKIVGLIMLPFSLNGNLVLVRYNSDGTIDTTFGVDGFVYTALIDELGFLDKILLLPDDSILVCGMTLAAIQDLQFAVAKFDADGAPDATFGSGGIAAANLSNLGEVVYSVDVDSLGRVVVGGGARTTIAGGNHFAVTRYMPNGSPDDSFGIAGVIILDVPEDHSESVTSIKVLDSGKILLVGNSSDISDEMDETGILLVRLNADGATDNSFGDSGRQVHSFANQHAVLSSKLNDDGSVFVSGYVSDAGLRGLIAKFTPVGNLDDSFGEDGRIITPDLGLFGNVLQMGGTLYCGGTIAGDASALFQVRAFNLEGDPISAFGENGVFAFGMTESFNDFGGVLTLQADGKMLINGRTTSGGITSCALARLELESLSTTRQSTGFVSFGPNPFTNQIRIDFGAELPGNISFDLADVSGKLIASNLSNSIDGINSRVISPPNNLERGVYFLTVNHNDKRSVIKVIKE